MKGNINPPKFSIGQKLGKLEITDITREGYNYYCHCLCSCGKPTKIRQDSLLVKKYKSCGCDKPTSYNKTHGLSKTPLYKKWISMLGRCDKTDRKDYKHYGGRGIKVCERWSRNNPKGLLNFIADMEPSYEEGLELDRRDVDGDYSPENCRWATRSQQVINRRPTGTNFDAKEFNIDGDILCLREVSDKYKIPYRILLNRLGKLNWDFNKAVTEPCRPKYIKLVCDEGECLSVKEYCNKFRGVDTRFTTLKNKVSIERAVDYLGDNIQKVIYVYSGEEVVVWDKNKLGVTYED